MPRLRGWLRKLAAVPLCFCCSLALVFFAHAGEWPQKPAQQSRLDLYGDPLPPGAIARLGTVRWRHGSSVLCLGFSPDGKTIATGSYDRTIRLWQLPTGKEILRLAVLEGPHCLAVSPNGRTMAAFCGRGSNPKALYAWDVATGKELFKLHFEATDGETIESLVFSPDGKTLAGGSNKRIRFWDGLNGGNRGEIQGVHAGTFSVAYSPDGKLLASASGDHVIRLWNVATRQSVLAMHGHKSLVWALTFSPDSQILLSGSSDNTIRLWETATAKEIRTLQGHKDVVKSVAVSGDGKIVASGSRDGTVHLWDAISGAEIRKWEFPESGVDQVAFSPDGKTLATGGTTAHYCVRLWNVATGEEIVREQGHRRTVYSLAFSLDGKTLVSQSNGSIRSWEPSTARQLHLLGGNGSLNRFALSSDSQTVAFAERWGDKAIRLYDLAAGKEVRRLPGHEAGVWSLAFSPDGRILASGGFNEQDQDGRVHLWDVITGRQLHVLRGHKHYVYELAFSSDGKILASGSDTVRLWDVATGKALLCFQQEVMGPRSLTFSPDGKTLAFVDQRDVLRVWEVAVAKEIFAVPLKNGWGVAGLAFSPDGRTLGSGFSTGIVRLWDVPTAKAVLDLPGHEGRVNTLAFSHNGKTLASGSHDTSVLIWDTAAAVSRGLPAASEFGALDLADLWTDLASEDAVRAHKALWGFAASGEKAISWMKNRLRPVKEADYKSIDQLMAELDDKEFPVREAATKQLKNLGIQAFPKLHLALQGRPSPELRLRIEALLGGIQQPRPGSEHLRRTRAIQVLEHIGFPEASQILENLASGAAQAPQTQDAKAALQRVLRRHNQ